MITLKRLSWLAVFLWMALIFFLSHQPGSASSELSSGVVGVLLEAAEPVLESLSIDEETFHTFVRKNAHFFAYFILGVLVLNALRQSKIRGVRSAALTFVISALYAASDETHQLFIPGRSGEVRDVLIDSAGAAAGIAVWLLVQRIVGRKRGRTAVQRVAKADRKTL